MALVVYAVFLLHGCVLTYNDDFSHWGLIVRTMLVEDGFPAAGDPLITFTSYPPGTACLIYYVCRMVTGQASCEWGMLWRGCAAAQLRGRPSRRWAESAHGVGWLRR